MTELEKKIYECAKKTILEVKNKLNDIKTEARYISFPFYCDGVVDKLIYDTELKRFIKIEYSKGKGQGVEFVPSINKFSAHFDEIEYCSFEIPNVT